MLYLPHQNYTDMKIGIFCSANDNIDPDFFKLTEELGTWMATEGHTLVYGGCNIGLMECMGKAVHLGGGQTIGVIPSRMERGGKMSDYVDVHVPCDDLNDRKQLLMAQSDAFVALPGGVGTLDEIFTVAASKTVGYHNKKVVLYNMKGFWQSAIDLLDDLQKRGFVRGQWPDLIKVANSLDELRSLIANS